MTNPNKLRLLSVVLAVLTLVLALPILLLPLSADNDIYQAMAFAFYKGKGLPYLGSWDHNFPGIVFYHWLGITLFGLTDVAFRLIDLFNRFAIAYLTYRISRHYVEDKVARITPILVVTLYAGSGLWNAGQRDGFATTWLLIALLASLTFNGDGRRMIVIAFAVMAAAMIRPTNVLFALPFGAFLMFTRRWKVLLKYLTAAMISLLVLLSPWIVSSRGLSQFYYSAIRFNLDLYTPERNSWENAIASISLYLFIVICGLLGLLTVSFKSLSLRKLDHPTGWLAAYLVLGVLAIVSMGKYHIYHFEIILPLLIILTACLINTLPNNHAKLAVTLTVALIAFLLYYPRQMVQQFVKLGANENAATQIAHNLASFKDYSLQTEQSVSGRLAKYGVSDNDVEFALLWPGLRWRSGYTGVTRFTTSYALTLPSRSGAPTYQRAWIREYDSVLSLRMPSLVVAALGPEYLAS